jgi:hypothetical protein
MTLPKEREGHKKSYLKGSKQEVDKGQMKDRHQITKKYRKDRQKTDKFRCPRPRERRQLKAKRQRLKRSRNIYADPMKIDDVR